MKALTLKHFVLTLMLVASLFGTVANTLDLGTVPTLTISEYDVQLGNSVTINIADAPTNPAYAIRIFGPETQLRATDITKPLDITPPKNGTYTLLLYNMETGDLYDEKEITVFTPPEIQALESEAFSNRFITIAKDDYALNEPVHITINYKSPDFILRIQSPTTVYNFLGEPSRDVIFTPRELGSHEIQLIANNGIIERLRFNVKPDSALGYQNLPSTNIKNLIKDSNNNTLDPKRIEILYNGLTIQSNIDPNLEYEIKITPDDPFVQSVSFEGVTLTNQLDLGIETVNTSFNPAGAGELMGAFALDPSRLNFTNGTITVQSPGNLIYKCVDYDFATQTCWGTHQLIMTTSKGALVQIPFDALDPLYTFVDNTISCSCTDTQSPTANSGTISCNLYCPVTIDAPGATADSGFIQEIRYVVNLTVVPDATTISNPYHEGDFDHDQTQGNSNEINVGNNSAATTTQQLTWTRTGIDNAGADSFNDGDCDNWPTNCTNYYVYLSTSLDFQAPGASKKAPSVTITLDTLNVTWNYTLAGNLQVALNAPSTGSTRNSRYINFNYTPVTNAVGGIDTCSLYTNDTSWAQVNSSSSVANNVSQLLNYTYSDDGYYLWNVFCNDTDANTDWATNYTLTIDTLGPNITLLNPANNSVENGTAVTFQYNVTDQWSGIQNCSVYVNGSIETTDYSVTEGIQDELSASLDNGYYSWYLGCYDTAGNPNTSETRYFTVNKTPVIYTDRWYESYGSNCSGTGGCEIDLEQQTDGTINSRTMTLPAGDTITSLVNATSQYLGGNGAYIPAGDTITFRADFSAYSGGVPYVTWRLYSYHQNGSQDLICSFGNDDNTGSRIQAVGFEEGTCNTAQAWTLSGTDRLRLQITVFNDHPSQTSTITHDYDDANSYVEFTNFYTIGSLSVDLLQPSTNLSLNQNDLFNMTCETTCEYGYCLDTNVTAQYRPFGGTNWNTVSGTGNITLASGETNPHGLGNVLGNTTNSTNETFLLNASQAAVSEVRCAANDVTSTASSTTIRRITVQDQSAPIVTLVSPAEGAYRNTSSVLFTYNVSDVGSVDNCSIWLDGSINDTNTSITNPGDNYFTIPGIAEGDHNWTVTCIDATSLQGNASETRNFTVDLTPPNITLNYPAPGENLGINQVEFNFTAYDNRAENLTCNLYIDGSANVTGLSVEPGTPFLQNVTGFSVGLHNWSVNCLDNSLNYNTSETRTFNITDSPPVVILYQPPNNNYTGSTTVQFQYNVTDNNGLTQCELWFDGSINQTNTTIVNNEINNFTVTGISDGLHNWTVNCTDGTYDHMPTPWNITIDTVNPSVFLESPIDVLLNNGDVSFQFNFTDATSPNATCEIQYNTSVTTYTIPGVIANESQTRTYVQNNVPDGVFTWNTTCVDLGGNSGTSSIEAFNVSETPTVTLGTPAPNAFANGAQVNFTFTPNDNDGFTNCTLRLLTGPNVSDTVNQSPIISGSLNGIVVNNLASGSHTWSVRCYDNGTFTNVFQPSSRFLFIDNEDPTITLNSPVDITVNNSYVNFNWTADDDQDLTLSCDLYIDGSLNVSSIPSTAGSPTNQTVFGFANGLHNWSMNCSDDAGNSNMTAWTNFTVAVPPNITLTDPAPGAYLNFTTDVTFGYIPSSNDPLANCTLYIDGVENETDTNVTADNNEFFFINFSASQEGQHYFNVSCYDTGGLRGTGPENRTFYIDLTGPNTTLNAPGQNVTVSTNNVTFNFTPDDNFSPNVTCDLNVNGFPEVENAVYNTSQVTTENVLLIDGFYLWNVTCTDLAGNINTTETRNFTIYAPPNVTALDPFNNSYENSSTVVLTYYVEDGFPIPECNLTVNGAYNQTDSSVSVNQNNTFTLNSLGEGLYNWSVYCIDQDDNIGTSETLNFYVDLYPANITLNAPDNGQNFSVDDVLFNWTADDTLDTTLQCNLTIDDTVEGNNLSVTDEVPYNYTVYNFTDGLHYWNVTCIDDALWTNTSETRNFNISVTPYVVLLTLANNTWTNFTTITFTFNVTDNDGLQACQLEVDGSPSTTNTSITNNANNTIINGTLPEATINWTVTCTDNGTYNNQYTPNNFTLNIDRTAPNITLLAPPSGSGQISPVTFNYSIIEALSPYANCSLWLDGTNISFDALTNGSFRNFSYPASVGTHYWNVTCIDFADNNGISETWNFSIVPPDLRITSVNISFSDPNAIEGTNVTVFANVENIGVGDADAFNVSFFRGDPDSGGVQIGPNRIITSLLAGQNQTVNVTFITIIGNNNIFVRVDVPLATNGSLYESNESNNEANLTLNVAHYEIFSGNTTDELHIDDSTLTSLFRWGVDNGTGGNLYVADGDSSIDFLSLYALSRTTAAAYEFNDFAELDVELNSTNYPDSINDTYTSAGTPVLTKTYDIFGQAVANVPVVNSTNTSSFQTGILWDSSDGGANYNGTQDIVFITNINDSKVGYTGTYDYEFKVPATLRDYIPGGGVVTFYAEIR